MESVRVGEDLCKDLGKGPNKVETTSPEKIPTSVPAREESRELVSIEAVRPTQRDEAVFTMADEVVEDPMCELDGQKYILETDENLVDLSMDEDFSHQLDSLLDAH